MRTNKKTEQQEINYSAGDDKIEALFLILVEAIRILIVDFTMAPSILETSMLHRLNDRIKMKRKQKQEGRRLGKEIIVLEMIKWKFRFLVR